MFKIIILISGLFVTLNSASQKTITVAESSIKLGLMAEDIFYLGFAKGDKLIFSFEEENGKEVKEIEIIEMPGTSKFMELKTKKITNRVINIPTTGIYKFRFSNKSITNRTCNYKIERIPSGAETETFNTSVYTHTVYDTTFSTEQENYIDRTDTIITNFQDRVTLVNSLSTPGGNKANFNFSLPENIISWSFYFFTNEEGLNEFTAANKKLSQNPKFNNYNLLAALAFNNPVEIKKLQQGNAIDYWIAEGENAELFMKGEQFRYMKKDNAINEYAKMEPRKGNLFFCFSNNTSKAIKVTTKITTVHINEKLAIRQTKKFITTPRTEMYLKN